MTAIEGVSARRQPSSGQSGQQPGKPTLRPVVLNRHCQRLPLPDQHHQFLAACDARVNQIALQQHVLLHRQGRDDGQEF